MTMPIVFPTIEIGGKFIKFSFDNLSLQKASLPGYKSGAFTGMIIYDSRGHKFKVLSVWIERGRGPFWGYSLFFYRNIYVGLELSEPEPYDLQEVKNYMLKHTSYWRGWLDKEDRIAERKDIGEAQTLADLIAIMERYVFD